MKFFKWLVIGAGPAGILAVGKLLDLGIPEKSILWVDPHFAVGDLGTKWKNVPSNTKIKFFKKFLNSTKSFHYKSCPKNKKLKKKPEETCFLKEIVSPLQWVTKKFLKKINHEKKYIQSLRFKKTKWEFEISKEEKAYAENVILAIGSDPIQKKDLKKKFIPLEIALNPIKLRKKIKSKDKIAVLGSSHSAILVLKNLYELNLDIKIINFYRNPLKFAVEFPSFILHDNTGLKGTTAYWAKQKLLKNIPEKIERIHIQDPTFKNKLKQSNKIIYAIGFQARKITIKGLKKCKYHPKTGIIGPGLFGIGIAFPELISDPFGQKEYNVGLYKFNNYIQKILPLWCKSYKK